MRWESNFVFVHLSFYFFFFFFHVYVGHLQVFFGEMSVQIRRGEGPGPETKDGMTGGCSGLCGLIHR